MWTCPIPTSWLRRPTVRSGSAPATRHGDHGRGDRRRRRASARRAACGRPSAQPTDSSVPGTDVHRRLRLTASGDTVYRRDVRRRVPVGLGSAGPGSGPKPIARGLSPGPSGWSSTAPATCGWRPMSSGDITPGAGSRSAISDVRDIAQRRGTLAVATGLALMVRSDGDWSTIDQDSRVRRGHRWRRPGLGRGQVTPGRARSRWSFDRTRAIGGRSPVRLPNGVTQVTAIAADEDGTLWVRGGTDFVEIVLATRRADAGSDSRRWARRVSRHGGGSSSLPGGDLLAVMSVAAGPGLVGRYPRIALDDPRR